MTASISVLSTHVYEAIITRIAEYPPLATTRVISMYDSDPSEKKTDNPYIAVGVKSYELGENVVVKKNNVDTVTSNRHFTAEIKINFYTRFENGTDRCLYLFDTAIRALLFSDFVFDVTSIKMSEAKYRQDMGCMAIESVCTVKGIYKH